MNSRLIRVLLVILAIAIGVAASYFLTTIDSKATRHRTASDLLRDHAGALIGTVSEVRAAQVAYVARGQGEDFWMSRVAKLLPVLDQQMAEFDAALTSPAAQADFESAAAAVENFHKLDARARNYVRERVPLLASDLIFSDGVETMGTTAAQIEAALKSELQASEADLATLRISELKILGSAGGGMLLILMMLGFTGASKTAKATVPEAAPQPVLEQEPQTSIGYLAVANLESVAHLCTDLARMLDPRQLPDLLERAAKIMDASGIIVWLADSGGQQLHPAMSFGYSDQVMAKMGSIPRDANNAAAAAYRSSQMRTVSGDGFANGALVAPLLTPDGCVGVLSAEMKGGSEKDESAQAFTSIVAAQLVTLVSTPPRAALDKTATG